MIKKFTGYRVQGTVKIISVFFTALLLYLFPIPYFLFPAHAQQASLSLSPVSGTFNRGCSFILNINLSTGGEDTDGTDAILIYDPSRFSATSISNGTIYSEYAGNNIDEQNGKITISGLASFSSRFNGSGKLATINFVVKEAAATGATQITFDFNPTDKAKTTDTNVVKRTDIDVVDVLNSVTNGNYTIGTSACASASTPPGSGTGTGTGTGAGTGYPTGGTGFGATPSGEVKQPYPPGNLDQAVGGKTGNESLTFTVAIVGSVMVVLGILGLALL